MVVFLVYNYSLQAQSLLNIAEASFTDQPEPVPRLQLGMPSTTYGAALISALKQVLQAEKNFKTVQLESS